MVLLVLTLGNLKGNEFPVLGSTMVSLVQYLNHDALNTIDTSTMGYYVINFISEACTLQEDTTCDCQIISPGGIVVNAHYLDCMQENTNWCLEQKNHQ